MLKIVLQLCLVTNNRSLNSMDYQNSSKDRTLGWTILQVSDLIQEGQDKSIAPWVSKGTVKASPMLQAHPGSDPKGTLYYEATFFTCTPMPGLAFDPPENAQSSGLDTASIASHEDKHEKDIVDHRMQRDLERVKAQALTKNNTETPEIAVNGDDKGAPQATAPAVNNVTAESAAPKDGPPALSREEILQTGQILHPCLVTKLTSLHRVWCLGCRCHRGQHLETGRPIGDSLRFCLLAILFD